MDEVKDFFKELRERASSPLIASFIISWLVVNWQVSTAIIFNNADTLKADRWIYINQIIKAFASWWHMLYLPLILALTYVASYPWIKRKIKWYSAWQTAKGDAEILRTSGLEPVSLENYLIMVEGQRSAHNTLSELINSQRATLNDKTKLQSELESEKLRYIELQKNVIERDDKLNKIKSYSNIDMLHGYWTYYQNNKNDRNIQPWIFLERNVKVNNTMFTVQVFFGDYHKKQLYLKLVEEKKTIITNLPTPFNPPLVLEYVLEANNDFSKLTSIDKNFSLVKGDVKIENLK